MTLQLVYCCLVRYVDLTVCTGHFRLIIILLFCNKHTTVISPNNTSERSSVAYMGHFYKKRSNELLPTQAIAIDQLDAVLRQLLPQQIICRSNSTVIKGLFDCHLFPTKLTNYLRHLFTSAFFIYFTC